MAWPENWINVYRIAESQREQIMARTARDVGGPRLEHKLHQAVHSLLSLSPFRVGGVSLSSLPTLYHPAMFVSPDGSAVLRHRHYHAAYSTDDLYHAEAVFWTRRRRRLLARAWTDYNVVILGRASGFIGHVRRIAGQVAGDLPVHDAQGHVLTGQAALAKRLELYAGELCTAWRTAGHPDTMTAWLQSATAHDIAADELSPVDSEAQEQLMERIDIAAEEQLCYLLDCDDPRTARAATGDQESAIRLIETRRQQGRRDVRAAQGQAAARTAASAAVSKVLDVVLEHAPVWQSSTGGAITPIDGKLNATWAKPSSGVWTLGLRAARLGERRTATDEVVLDLTDLPDGWTVTRGARLAGVNAFPVTITAPAAPAAGVHEIPLVARDARGPSRLTVRVTVPASTQGTG